MAKHFKGEKGARDDKDRALAAAVAPHGNVFTRFTLRSLRANRVRTTVTIVGVALACGLLMAVLASVTSLRGALLDRQRTIDGVWQLSFDYTDESTLDNLKRLAGDHLDRLATSRDLGAAAVSKDNSFTWGSYLGVVTTPREDASLPRAAGDTRYDVIPDPYVEEGRLPEKPGEIALPSYLRGVELVDGASMIEGVAAGATSEGELELGGTITLALGRRTWLDDAINAAASIPSGTSLEVDYTYETDSTGNIISESETVLETLADVGEPRTYTVVGFIDPNFLDGDVAYVCPDEPAATASGTERSTAYFSTTGYSSYNDLSDLITAVLGAESGWRNNNSLLMYQGLEPNRQIIDSLEQFAAVLAVVIIVAAVSLISNAFRISISERTRQFGLLSSLGASRRQLRRTVFTEAALLGLVGIPLGIVIGIAGTAVVFALTAEGWGVMLGEDATIQLVIAPADLAIATCLTALTLLLSAFVPALRASRVSAVDAIRQSQDVRPSRRLRRVFRRRRDAMDDFSADCRRPRGMAARLGGMPAFLARRTLAVSASKSRVSTIALAISVALLVTAGLVSDYLNGAMSYMDYGNADMMMYASSAESSSDISEDPVASNMGGIASDIADVAGVREDSVSAVARANTDVHLDEDAVDWSAIDTFNERTNQYGGFMLDRQGYGQAVVELVDDGTWQRLAEHLGLPEDERDPTQLSCVVFNLLNATNTDASLTDDEWISMGDDGRYSLRRSDEVTGEAVDVAPVSELDLKSVSVPVAAYTADLGDDFPIGTANLADSTSITLVMPMSSLEEAGLTDAMWLSLVEFYAGFAEGTDEEAVIEGIQEALGERGDIDTVTINNLREALRQYRAMSYTVDVFLYSFIAITMAIAVANVFNTIASGLMLRTREFAALQSAGMGRGAFRRMIALECADFAAKGLVGGVALATMVNAALFSALSSSISTLVFQMPWGHIALSFGVVVAVLAISVAYALHKTHAMNLVEALRADAL